jgi:uncharacterized spore protein YtfJ
MDVHDMFAGARDAMTVQRVYGEPIERDGCTVIPVARVRGGGGGGDTPGEGGGGGFGAAADPCGVYVIAGGEVRWQPAFDLNRAVALGSVNGLLLLLLLHRLARRWGRRP